MHQTILMHADIDESTEVGHVGHHTFQDHPQLQVLEVFDAFLELGSLELRARVTARFLQFLENVGHGRQAEGLVGEFLRIKTFQEAGVADQRADVTLGVRSDALDQRVGFGVNRRAVQRVVTIHHAQETCRLLEGFFAQTADFFQRRTGFEGAVFVAVRHDVLRQRGIEARNSRQQRYRCGIHVHAHGVYAIFNHRVQAACQFELGHVVLVLADTDGFRVDFYQFGQRVLQAAGDRYGATDRNVQVRKFLGCQFRCRVHRSTGFGHHHFGDFQGRVFFHQIDHQLVAFTAGGTVADGNQVDRMLGTQGGHDRDGLVPLVVRYMRVHGGVLQQLAGGIDHGNLAAGAQARVQAQGGAWAGWCGQQQVMQVVGKNVDRFGFGSVAQFAQQVGFKVGVELDLPGPAHYFTQPFVSRAVLIFQAEALGNHHFAGVHRARQFFTNLERRAENAFVAPAENRQGTVRRHAFKRFVVLEVVAELGAFLFLAGNHAGAEDGFLLEEAAQLVQQAGVFGEALHEDVLGAIKGCLDVCHAFFGVDETGGFGIGRECRVVEQAVCQLAEAGFEGDLTLGAALLLVRQVQVFEAGLGVGELDVAGQFWRQLALFLDAGEDACAPFVEFAQVAQALFEVTQLGVIQAAGHFLTVAGDEGYGGALIEKSDGRFDLLRAHAKFFGDAAVDAVHKTT